MVYTHIWLWGHGTWVTSDGFCMQFIGDFENEDKEDRQVEVMEVAWGKCHMMIFSSKYETHICSESFEIDFIYIYLGKFDRIYCF